jgi:hypothetical protein
VAFAEISGIKGPQVDQHSGPTYRMTLGCISYGLLRPGAGVVTSHMSYARTNYNVRYEHEF